MNEALLSGALWWCCLWVAVSIADEEEDMTLQRSVAHAMQHRHLGTVAVMIRMMRTSMASWVVITQTDRCSDPPPQQAFTDGAPHWGMCSCHAICHGTLCYGHPDVDAVAKVQNN